MTTQAVVAAIEVAQKAGPDSLVVVLLPDGGRGYLSKIFNDRWMSSYGFLRTRLDGSVEESTVGDVLRGKSGALPDMVHTHPSETVRRYTGTPSVSEAAALLAAGPDTPMTALVVEKHKHKGADGRNATVSIARTIS